MALTLRRRPNDQLRLHELANLATQARVPTVVTNDVLFHEPDRRILQDVVTCIRHNVTIDELGFRRERHADRYLKPPRGDAPAVSALSRSRSRARWRSPIAAASRSTTSPTNIRRNATLPGLTAAAGPGEADLGGRGRTLSRGPARQGAWRSSSMSCGLIEKLEYAPYFLTVNSIVRFARCQDILCQGRGSAANSAVCFVLGIT